MAFGGVTMVRIMFWIVHPIPASRRLLAGQMETATLTRARRSRLRQRPAGLPPGAKT
jgi:heme exporter protein D